MTTSEAPGIDLAPVKRLRQTERPPARNVSIAGLPAQLALIGLVTITPWLFGGVQATVQVWLFVGVLIALAWWLIEQLTARAVSGALPLATVPLLAVLGLGALQLIPLREDTITVLSPAAAELRSSLLPTQSSADARLSEKVGIAAAAERQPLSLYPASTRRDLALLALAVAVFLLGATYFTSPRAQLWLCGLLAVNGAALAFFGLVQQLTWNGLLYWGVPLTHGGSPFSSFVNRNNAAGFLNLCLAGAVGITVWVGSRSRSVCGGGITTSPEERRPWLTRARDGLMERVARLDALTIAALSLTGCIVGGILCSLSRGAGIAMIGATLMTILLVLCARGGRVRWLSIGLVAATGLALVSWVGLTDSVHARFATLLDTRVVSEDRLAHWRDGLGAAADFWPAGSGLGTYRYVYRPYQERLSSVWYYHAENQYLEALVEGGIAGLGLLLILIGLVGMAAWRLLRDAPDAATFAFGVAGVFALTGQAIHSFFDFGLYIPANVLLFALVCGGVSGRAAHLAAGRWSPRFLALPRSGVLSTMLAASIFAITLWASVETRDVAAVETALRDVRLRQPPEDISCEALLDAIEQVGAVTKPRADDAEAQHRLATLWLHLYRARAYEQLRGETASNRDDSGLWQATSQIVFHGQAQRFARDNLVSQLERLRSEPVVRENLTRALEHLILARGACPLLPEVHAAVAELCVLVADPATSGTHVERARRLAPSDPALLFRLGLLDLQAGRTESACETWKRCLTLSHRYLDDVLFLAGEQPSPSQWIESVLPDSPSLLIQLARDRYAGEEHTAIRLMLAERAERLIDKVDLPEEEEHYLRGSAFALRGLNPQAIAGLSRAVELRPQEALWRYELASLLAQEGRIGEAHEHAKLSARMNPMDSRYRALLKEINHTRLATTTSRE